MSSYWSKTGHIAHLSASGEVADSMSFRFAVENFASDVTNQILRAVPSTFPLASMFEERYVDVAKERPAVI
jgi:hypothetical protein